MTARKAIIGDIHGCLAELKDLHEMLLARGVEEFYHLGDLIDRGPDSPGVVRYCRVHGIRGVMGNHESSLLALIDKSKAPHFYPESLTPEKQAKWEIARALSADDIAYIRNLPRLHVLAEDNLVLVHGGLWPNRSPSEQDRSVLYLRVIHPDRPGEVRWLNRPGHYTLEDSRREGFSPWYEIYNGDESVVYGHTVHSSPKVHGSTFGIDTGCVYGGALTALVLPDKSFVSVPAHRSYAVRSGA